VSPKSRKQDGERKTPKESVLVCFIAYFVFDQDLPPLGFYFGGQMSSKTMLSSDTGTSL